ncbi:TPA: shufflon protein C [Salmonella enterica]|uniref:Shufflon protein C n=1 Tax=Salmonella enterica TaxID=28901 RepID=A0A744JF49_SALER|nr:shufflon protein C [Salmonella enterica]
MGWGCRWGNLPVLARYRIGTFAPVPRFTTQVYDIGQNVNAQYIGIHAFCSWTHLFSAPLGGRQKVFNVGNAWYVTNTPYGGFQTGSIVSVTCLNLPGAGD